ncbi:MAG: hypothetical protein WCR31_02455 [Treponema sp.]
MTKTGQNKKYEAVITMDDEYFINCILELEPLIEEGWHMERLDRNSPLNTMFVTLEKNKISSAGQKHKSASF